MVEEMEDLNEADEQIRVLLNRKARVKDIKLRTISNTNRMTGRLDHTSSFKNDNINPNSKHSPFNTLKKNSDNNNNIN